eukprot:TRINITY_DN33161_c0_g1_i1.p1 TRINITY_DN33161_c0_g1~~TRINITY_DN33161_c0_g1_i1.p1  ORF type:complete len:276 (-),score=67.10 TRINITY_DN33161_c0_g1_i1:19-846(-)
MSLCNCLPVLCGGGGDTVVCSLCLESVSGDVWSSGEHRSQCASRNTAKLSSFPAHPHLSCTKCNGRLRVWPAQGPKFTCDSPANSCQSGEKARQSPAQQNRFTCYLCDYNLCKQCVQRMDNERIKQKENSRQLVSCLKSMCDRVKEKVAEESKQKKQASFDSYTSIMLDTDHIPLIDESIEDDTDLSPVSCKQPVSYSEDHNTSIAPHRRSVVSCNIQPYQVLNTSLPQKQPDGLSPDVFHIRAPLVSWENFMTPAGSAETIFDTLDGTKLENRQ